MGHVSDVFVSLFYQMSNYVFYGESSNKKSKRQRKLDENLSHTICKSLHAYMTAGEMKMMQSLTSNKNEDPLLKSLWEMQMEAKQLVSRPSLTPLSKSDKEDQSARHLEEEKGATDSSYSRTRRDTRRGGAISPPGHRAKSKFSQFSKINASSKPISKFKGDQINYGGSHMLRPRKNIRIGRYTEESEEEEEE
jgi:hypothetical protein